jgi:DNA-binding NtrC family response regulator
MNPEGTINRFSALVVDDDHGFRSSLGMLVGREGFDVREAGDLKQARDRLGETAADLVLVDRGLPDGDGIELLRDERLAGDSDFVVITGNASVDSAVQALRVGALDYLTKPIDQSRLKSILAGVSRTRRFKAEVRSLRGELRQLGRFGRLVGRSPAMQQVYDLIARVAPTQAGVFLTGDSGTGKELAAETIHLLSRRRDGPFLAVNCGAIAPTLIESELFGHEKGSFTGAEGSRRGYFEEANGGTLFLDEVTEMPPELQAKLLRVLETSAFLRVGGSKPVPVDVRVIAATNRDPARAVRERALREDLYYRLNVFPIHLPSLGARGEDLELLAEHFLDAVNAREETRKTWSAAARTALRAYRWPGNVRELKNAVERAAILADNAIGPELLPSPAGGGPVTAGPGPMLQLKVGASLAEIEHWVIHATLEHLRGDKKKTAEVLGISLKTLYSRLSARHEPWQAGHGLDPAP